MVQVGPAGRQNKPQVHMRPVWQPWEVDPKGKTVPGRNADGTYDPSLHSKNGVPVGTWRYVPVDLAHNASVDVVDAFGAPKAVPMWEIKGFVAYEQALAMFPGCEKKLPSNWQAVVRHGDEAVMPEPAKVA